MGRRGGVGEGGEVLSWSREWESAEVGWRVGGEGWGARSSGGENCGVRGKGVGLVTRGRWVWTIMRYLRERLRVGFFLKSMKVRGL